MCLRRNQAPQAKFVRRARQFPKRRKSVAQGHEEPTVLAQLAMKLGNLTSPPVLP